MWLSARSRPVYVHAGDEVSKLAATTFETTAPVRSRSRCACVCRPISLVALQRGLLLRERAPGEFSTIDFRHHICFLFWKQSLRRPAPLFPLKGLLDNLAQCRACVIEGMRPAPARVRMSSSGGSCLPIPFCAFPQSHRYI